jgi:hypothetical protein
MNHFRERGSMVQSNEIVRIRMKADIQILPALLAFIYG